MITLETENELTSSPPDLSTSKKNPMSRWSQYRKGHQRQKDCAGAEGMILKDLLVGKARKSSRSSVRQRVISRGVDKRLDNRVSPLRQKKTVSGISGALLTRSAVPGCSSRLQLSIALE